MEFLGHYLPGLFWQWLAKKYSQKSRARSAHYRQQNQEEIRSMIRQHALRSFSERPFDLIVSGHMHVFDDFSFTQNGQQFRSINLGSWLEEPRVLQITHETPGLAPEIQWIDPTRL
jgi:UDP-2,3-diacylglucosamine hydrolase